MRRLVIAMAIVTLAAGLVGCATATGTGGGSAAPSASTRPTGTTAPPGAAGDACRPQDLDARPIYGSGAAGGTAGQHVVVRDASATPCTLTTFPALRYTDSAGRVQTMPADRYPWDGSTDQPSVVLAPGGYAGLIIFYQASDNGGPACGHPTDHAGMSVLLAGGQPYPLPGLGLHVQCGTPSVRAWEPVSSLDDIPNARPASDLADCQPKDLDPRPYYSTGGGAMGTVGWYVTVQNSGPTTCRLGDYPVLYDSGTPIRQDRTQSGQQPVLLPPGRYASFLVLTHIGDTGYDANDPACQHPEHYRNMSVALAGGKRFPLAGFTIGFQCEQAHVGSWAGTDGAPLPNPTRAP